MPRPVSAFMCMHREKDLEALLQVRNLLIGVAGSQSKLLVFLLFVRSNLEPVMPIGSALD